MYNEVIMAAIKEKHCHVINIQAGCFAVFCLLRVTSFQSKHGSDRPEPGRLSPGTMTPSYQLIENSWPDWELFWIEINYSEVSFRLLQSQLHHSLILQVFSMLNIHKPSKYNIVSCSNNVESLLILGRTNKKRFPYCHFHEGGFHCANFISELPCRVWWIT